MDDMTLLGIKAAVAAGVAALTAVWGWFGWLVLAWLLCMALDYGTGTAANCGPFALLRPTAMQVSASVKFYVTGQWK